LRQTKGTRSVPLVFVDGEPQKVAAVRRLLPDAVFTTWENIGRALARAIAEPPTQPIVPKSLSGPDSGTPLTQKLGIRGGTTVQLLGVPSGFERTLGRLPADTKVRRGGRGRRDLTIWFVRTKAALRRDLARVARAAADGGLWIAWQKQASGAHTDVTAGDVRRIAHAAGLVDNKVCAIDAVWSALRFARRRSG
jgi:hypothetical protein